jgi:hypothetical protein
VSKCQRKEALLLEVKPEKAIFSYRDAVDASIATYDLSGNREREQVDRDQLAKNREALIECSRRTGKPLIFQFLANNGQPAPYPLAVRARNGRFADHPPGTHCSSMKNAFVPAQFRVDV